MVDIQSDRSYAAHATTLETGRLGRAPVSEPYNYRLTGIIFPSRSAEAHNTAGPPGNLDYAPPYSYCSISRVLQDSAQGYAVVGNRSTPKKKIATTAAIAIHHHQLIIYPFL